MTTKYYKSKISVAQVQRTSIAPQNDNALSYPLHVRMFSHHLTGYLLKVLAVFITSWPDNRLMLHKHQSRHAVIAR